MADFSGRWAIERTIDHADGTTARFSGEAVFQPNAAGGLDYSEDGVLRMPGGQSMRATRRYRWDPDLSVFFEDGRTFHQVPATGGTTVHYCDPDTYRVAYEFRGWPTWQAVWTVTGPKKDYRMTSVYAPLA